MSTNVIKLDYNKKLYYVVMIELLICFTMDVVLNKNIFLILGIILDISIATAIAIGIIIFNNNYVIIALTLICSFSLTYLSENLGFPSSIKYIQDIFILMMAAKIIIYYINRNLKINGMYYLMLIFLACSCCSFILHPKDIVWTIKALYFDYLRYFIVAIFIMNISLPKAKLLKYIKGLWYALLIQVPLIIFQYFWSLNHWKAKEPGDIVQDYLSGTFGGRGTTELGLIVIIALTTLFLLYLNNKVKLSYFITMSILFVTILMIAEVKIVLVLLPIMFLIVLIPKINIKSIATFMLIIAILGVGMSQLQKLYPKFNNFFTTSSIEKYTNEAYGSSGIGRTDSFIKATEFITDNVSNTLLGYGVGSADIISKGIIFSAFNVSQYITECGYLGVSCIYGIFIYMIYASIYIFKYSESKFEKILGQVGIISILVIIISTFNNRSMVKINFAVFAWMLIGLVYKYYCSCKEKRKLLGRKI